MCNCSDPVEILSIDRPKARVMEKKGPCFLTLDQRDGAAFSAVSHYLPQHLRPSRCLPGTDLLRTGKVKHSQEDSRILQGVWRV
jgi:hypothetical protein